MKRAIFSGFALLSAVATVFGQASPLYQNDGTVLVPPQIAPQIDATNFVNNGTFDISLDATGGGVGSGGGGGVIFPGGNNLFDFTDVLNFTNRSIMNGSPGFRFDTISGATGKHRAAANFVNSTKGIITVSSKLLVNATNIVNSGALQSGSLGLIKLDGQNVILDRSHVSGGNTNSWNMFAGTWGVGKNITNGLPNLDVPFASSQVQQASDVHNGGVRASINLNAAEAFTYVTMVDDENITTQVVFIQNQNPAVTNVVKFAPDLEAAIPVIQWQGITTNILGVTLTNELYLYDTFMVETNLELQPFGIFGIPPALQQTFKPINYNFLTSLSIFDQLDDSNIDFDPAFMFTNRTNDWTLLFATFEDTSIQFFTNIPYANLTNLAGRMEINATNYLSMNGVRIDGPNYLSLNSTNHFAGSKGALIITPHADLNLGTTNGSLTISNLLSPTVTQLVGDLGVWSSRWTNVIGGITNRTHVMIVYADLSPFAPSDVQSAKFRGDNVVIGDVLNITHDLLINATNLTLTRNSIGALSPSGQLNFLADSLIWSESLPRLNYLTNAGTISIGNSAYFAGTRHSPYYNTTFEEAYRAFVNRGTVAAAGVSVWADYLENVGTGQTIVNPDNTISLDFASITASNGPITLKAGTAISINGILTATNSDISISAQSLVVSNTTMDALGKITLQITNSIADGGAAALSQAWNVQDGMDLLVKPATGDLLGTVVVETLDQDLGETVFTWAGEDRGNSTSGFNNNVAIGHLVLNGLGLADLFTFRAAGSQNAMYIDLLELDGSAADTINGTNYLGVNVEPNMVVYYAAAMAVGVDVSAALNGQSGGRLVWVPGFQGKFSSQLRSHVPMQTLQGLGNGIQIQRPSQQKTLLSWQTPANSTNSLYSCTNLANPHWTLVTNFVQSSIGGIVNISDTAKTSGAIYYKIRVDPRKP